MTPARLAAFRRWAASACAAAAFATAAPAQEAPAPPPADAAADPNDTVVDALMVKAARPGPAFWKATRGDSVVWIMGEPQALPRNVTWNQAEMKRHLQGAKVLVLGPDQAVGNVFSLIWIFLTQRDKFRAEGPLEQTLPPDMFARYDKAIHRPGAQGRRASAAEPAADNNIKPILAALFVSFSAQRGLNMQQQEPERTIRRQALFRVRTERAGETVLLDFVKLLQNMPRPVELTCMDDALRQAEAGPGRTLEAAKGWARGDLRVALSAERGWERCISQDKEIAAINDRNIQAAADHIAAALKTPGKAVAVVDLRPLLAQNGVIVRLKAMGVEITAPDVPGLEDEP